MLNPGDGAESDRCEVRKRVRGRKGKTARSNDGVVEEFGTRGELFCDLRQIGNAFINTISQQTPDSQGRQLLHELYRGSDLACVREF